MFWGDFLIENSFFRDRNSKLAINVFKRMILILEHVGLAGLQ